MFQPDFFVEQTFKAIKVHLFSLFKDATPVFLVENLNVMLFFLQKRNGQFPYHDGDHV